MEVLRAGQVASPPATVPRPLRALVRFAKLNDHSLATVRRALDHDDALRARVLAAIEAQGRQDRVGRASLLFLQRPPGWEDELDDLVRAAADEAEAEVAARADAAAARRLPAVEAALARAEAEAAPLRDEAVALRGELADVRRALRIAESDAGRLRKRIAELERATMAGPPPPAGDEGEGSEAVAGAERRARTAEDAAAAERTRADAAETAAAAAAEELERLRSAGAAAATGVDEQVVTEAVSDAVAAVGALADALGRAARALTGEPEPGAWPVPPADAPPGSGRPPRAVPLDREGSGRTPVVLPPATFDDTVEAVDHLLRVPRASVFVDGYNVTLSARPELALAEQRRWLLDALAGLAARTGAEFQVVFDGAVRGGPSAEGGRHLGVQVRFTAADVEADDEILHLVAGLPGDRPAVVVSDDRRVRDGARRLGANVAGVASLLEALRRPPS